jgi:hypothetical protein
MANEKKSGLSEEYLRKFKHRSGYVISESPKYRPLVTDNEEFDEIPMLTNEAGDEEDAPKQGQIPSEPSNDQPQNADAPETPVPAFDAETGGVPPEGEMTDPMGDPTAGDMPVDPMGAPAPESPENEVDDLQNEIIKHNIEAMRGIHDQLANLDSTIQGLNSKMDVLSADVEEVREPTDSEKLMNKTEVSYPYYFNLNDFWKDNWFDQKRAQNTGINGGDAEEQGMKELPDGTYVADFDDLPQKSKIDVQNSFNEI